MAITQAPGARVGEGGASERVLAGDLEVFDAVENQVHPRDPGRREVLLLTVDFAVEGARVTALAHDVLDSAEQHATSAAGGVVDALALLGVEDLDHHSNDAPWGIELAGLVAPCHVGELPHEIFVGITQDVCACLGIPESDP